MEEPWIRWRGRLPRRLAGPEARLNAYLDAYYHAQILSSFLDSKNGGDTVVNVGAKDVFHGPTAASG